MNLNLGCALISGLLKSTPNSHLLIRFGCKKPSFPYKPKRIDIRIKQITKVTDREVTPQNEAFLKKIMTGMHKDPNFKSPLKEKPWSKGEWFSGVKRTGVLAKKIGQFPQWLSSGRKLFVTLLQVHDNHVINYTPPEEFAKSITCKPYWKGKFGTITVGATSVDPRMLNPSYNSLFEDAGLAHAPKSKLVRFVVHPEAAIQPGTPLTAMHFKAGQYVDVEARTIFHGFQGVMKRWGFKGGPSKSNTKNHRRPGSFGGGKYGDKKSPGTVHKGTRMAGLMGNRTRCQRGLRVWRINTKHNVLYVHGYAIPGPINSYVKVFDTRIYNKSAHLKEEAPPFPTYYAEEYESKTGPPPEDIIHEGLRDLGSPTINYKDSIEPAAKK